MSDLDEQDLQLVSNSSTLGRFSNNYPVYWTTRNGSPTNLTLFNLWGQDWNNERWPAADMANTTDLSQGLEKVKRGPTF